MATANKEVRVIEEVLGYDLHLSVEEAEAVMAVLGQCRSGGVTSAVYHALKEAGAQPYAFYVENDSEYRGSGSIALVLKRKS